MSGPTPNTGEEYNGKTPSQIMYSYAKNKHICPRCKIRWVEPNVIFCEPCVASQMAANARQRRKRTKDIARSPRQVEVLVAQTVRNKTKTLVLTIWSDMGRLLTVHNLESVDVRDASKGAVKITTFRTKAAVAGKKVEE